VTMKPLEAIMLADLEAMVQVLALTTASLSVRTPSHSFRT
jgi:hypothetical protein